MKEKTSWYSHRVEQTITLTRYGAIGRPVLLFPTAGGDAEEAERFLMLDALAPLLAEGRIKVFSVDSVAGHAWAYSTGSGAHRAWLQNQFDACIYQEVVPAIRRDCRSDDISVVATGASMGAFNALASICRHPDAFDLAICMSGTYDIADWAGGEMTLDLYYSSPLHFMANLGEGEQLRALRERFVILASGEGEFEDPSQTWRVADVLGRRDVPNRVDMWGAHYPHDWQTWRDMLPTYLSQHV